jgi:hypothetical protein
MRAVRRCRIMSLAPRFVAGVLTGSFASFATVTLVQT